MIHIALVLFVLTGPAFADWQFAKWGMSVDELIAASDGAVIRTSMDEALNHRLEFELGHALAKGSYKTNEFEFVTYFYAPRGKLAGVRLVLRDSASNSRLLDHLTRVYGKPVSAESKLIAGCIVRSARWNDTTDGNVVRFSGLAMCDRRRFESGAALYTPNAAKSGQGFKPVN